MRIPRRYIDRVNKSIKPTMDVGICVRNVGNGEFLLLRNHQRPFSIVAHTRVLTTAAAYDTLQNDERFEWKLVTQGLQNGGVLEGDLVIEWADPELVRGLDQRVRQNMINDWAQAVFDLGIDTVQGDIVVIGIRPEKKTTESAPYTTATSAPEPELLWIAPGPEPGAPAMVMVRPPGATLRYESSCTTGTGDVSRVRIEGTQNLRVGGEVGKDSAPVEHILNVEQPGLDVAAALHRALVELEVAVEGGVVVGRGDFLNGSNFVARGLPELQTTLEKALHGKDASATGPLLMIMGRALGAADNQNWREGLDLMRDFLRNMGLTQFRVMDATGFQAKNAISPEGFSEVLAVMSQRHGDSFKSIFRSRTKKIPTSYPGESVEVRIHSMSTQGVNIGWVDTENGSYVYAVMSRGGGQAADTITATIIAGLADGDGTAYREGKKGSQKSNDKSKGKKSRKKRGRRGR